MVALIRDLVNTTFSNTSKVFTSILIVQKFCNMDINMNTNYLREKSTSASTNSSREPSLLFNVSSILYHKKMEIQSNNPLWSKQMEIEERESFSLSYATPKVGENKSVKQAIDISPKNEVQCVNNKALILNNMTTP